MREKLVVRWVVLRCLGLEIGVLVKVFYDRFL